MKGKFTSVILAVVLVVITVGTVFFGYSKASGKAAKSSVEGEQRYAWPLATCSTEDTITHIFATQFAKEVEKLSDGKMKINVYPQSTLGGDRELMESCKDGEAHWSWISTHLFPELKMICVLHCTDFLPFEAFYSCKWFGAGHYTKTLVCDSK